MTLKGGTKFTEMGSTTKIIDSFFKETYFGNSLFVLKADKSTSGKNFNMAKAFAEELFECVRPFYGVSFQKGLKKYISQISFSFYKQRSPN